MGPDGLPVNFAANLQSVKGEIARRIYKFIGSCRQKGISLTNLEAQFYKQNLTSSDVRAGLKELVSRELVVAMAQSQKKMFFLTECRPVEQSRPGWFNGSHYDEQYVAQLFSVIGTCVAQARTQAVDMDYIVNLVRNSQRLRSRMPDDEIKTLVNAMVYNGELVEYFNRELTQTCYLLPGASGQTGQFQPFYQGQYWRTVPCGRCQFINVCGPDQGMHADICAYMQEWLQGK